MGQRRNHNVNKKRFWTKGNFLKIKFGNEEKQKNPKFKNNKYKSKN